MPKIGPNKVSVDPKAYAARVTSAKKRVAQIDPTTKAKLSEYYPKVTREDVAKQALDTKKAETFRAAAGMKKSKSMDKMPARKPPAGVKMPTVKNAPVKPKAPVKKKVLVMPNKISPSKMTPAQKARYLKNPERYDY